jgi:hypothetical protein
MGEEPTWSASILRRPTGKTSFPDMVLSPVHLGSPRFLYVGIGEVRNVTAQVGSFVLWARAWMP